MPNKLVTCNDCIYCVDYTCHRKAPDAGRPDEHGRSVAVWPDVAKEDGCGDGVPTGWEKGETKGSK